MVRGILKKLPLFCFLFCLFFIGCMTNEKCQALADDVFQVSLDYDEHFEWHKSHPFSSERKITIFWSTCECNGTDQEPSYALYAMTEVNYISFNAGLMFDAITLSLGVHNQHVGIVIEFIPDSSEIWYIVYHFYASSYPEPIPMQFTLHLNDDYNPDPYNTKGFSINLSFIVISSIIVIPATVIYTKKRLKKN